MSGMGIAAMTVVCAQLVLTVVLQPLHRTRWIARLDQMAIVPMWMFFTFGSLGEDWHMLVRDGIGDAPVGDWRRLAAVPPGGAARMVWNPRKHIDMHVTSLLESLVRRAAKDPHVTPDESRSYAALLAIAFGESGPRFGQTRQFCVVRTRPHEPPERLFTSRLHSAP